MTSVTSVVPSASSADLPAAALMPAMEVAMALRKIRPTSCTCAESPGHRAERPRRARQRNPHPNTQDARAPMYGAGQHGGRRAGRAASRARSAACTRQPVRPVSARPGLG